MKTASKLELSLDEVITAVDFYLNTHVFQAEAAQRVTAFKTITSKSYGGPETFEVGLEPKPLDPEEPVP